MRKKNQTFEQLKCRKRTKIEKEVGRWEGWYKKPETKQRHNEKEFVEKGLKGYFFGLKISD